MRDFHRLWTTRWSFLANRAGATRRCAHETQRERSQRMLQPGGLAVSDAWSGAVAARFGSGRRLASYYPPALSHGTAEGLGSRPAVWRIQRGSHEVHRVTTEQVRPTHWRRRCARCTALELHSENRAGINTMMTRTYPPSRSSAMSAAARPTLARVGPQSLVEDGRKGFNMHFEAGSI